MSATTLIPTAGAPACSFLLPDSPPLGPQSCDLWRDLCCSDYDGGGGPLAASSTEPSAAVEFLDFDWPGDEASGTAQQEEERVLDDLLRLGLELGDLEEVFGNTNVDDLPGGGQQQEDCRGVGSDSDCCAPGGDGRDQEACCSPAGSGEEDAEDLLLDADLQEALLALPEMGLAEEQQEDEHDGGEADPECAPVSLAVADVDLVTPPLSPPPPAGAASAATVTAIVSPEYHQISPSVTCGDSVDGESPPLALDAAGTAPAAPNSAAIDCAVAAPSGSGGSGGDSSGGCTGGDTPEAGDAGNGDADFGFAATDLAASAAGVPTRLLDAIDLWESANARGALKERASGSDGGVAAATRRSGGAAGKGSRKKKNEFGKRRRSSGGGNAPAPGARPKDAGKAKVDPLMALKDVRRSSRKPLIVQWLRSDGCESDAEAEAAVGKAAGSLAFISDYWGGGG